ncbi:FkbM family methyltransferase, partial [Dolichospermum planctonicum]
IDIFSSIWAATIFSRRSTEYAFMTVLSLLLLTVPHNFGNCCKIQLQSDSQTHSLNNIELSENSINTEIISVKTIDDFLLSSKIDNIDLLKIDTEGYELQVLKGAEQSLKNNKIKLILAESTIQSDDKFHTNLNTLNRYLENYNFKITAIYDQVIWRNPTRLSYFNVLFSKQ